MGKYMYLIKHAAAIAVLGLTLCSTAVQSKEHKIVLIHGLQPQQLISDGDVTASGQDYWKGYWNNLSDARIDWPSYERIEGKIATDYLWPKLKSFSQKVGRQRQKI